MFIRGGREKEVEVGRWDESGRGGEKSVKPGPYYGTPDPIKP
jgi:hypothetical protein